jgi:lantibiotic modifying enzyme
MSIAFGLLFAAVLLQIPPAMGQAGRPNLDRAKDVAKWLRASAVAQGADFAWPITPAADKTPNASLYSGTPGVVLFFLQLHQATNDPADRDTAMAGARWLAARVPTERDAGLYTGLAGIAFTLTEVSKITGDRAMRDAANAAIDRLKAMAKPAGAGVEWSPVSDIISGTSGIGLALMAAARDLNRPDALDLARAAGRRLVEQQMAAEGGAKWAMTPSNPTRLYPNFSHGTAGVAYFLATLYDRTRDRAFLDAAVGGARYLTKVAKTDGDVCLVFHHEPEADGLNLYYLGWCHGPAGTVRLFHRLARVTGPNEGKEEWKTWTRRSINGLVTSGVPEKETPGFWNNVGQCCGSTGLAEFFLSHHADTGDAASLAAARRITAQILSRATSDASGTRWTHAEHRVQPANLTAQTGWMQGAAGIGAWLLRLDAFEQKRAWRLVFPDSPF